MGRFPHPTPDGLPGRSGIQLSIQGNFLKLPHYQGHLFVMLAMAFIFFQPAMQFRLLLLVTGPFQVLQDQYIDALFLHTCLLIA